MSMNGRQAWENTKNNKNGNTILNSFLIKFEYVINCLRNYELSLPNTTWRQKAPNLSKDHLEQKHRHNKIQLRKIEN